MGAMKRAKYILSVLVLLHFITATYGQNGCVSIGTALLDRGFDAVRLSAGGILAVGYTEGIGGGLRDGYFAKINVDGTFGWGKAFGGSNNEELYDIVPWGSNYALLGYTRSYGAGSSDALVLIIDDAGNVLGAYVYGGTGGEQAKAGVETAVGNLAIVGFSYSYSSGGADMYVFTIDNSGTLLWGVGIGGSGDDRGRGITTVGDTALVTVGYTNSAGAGGYDFYIVSLDVNGNVKWTRTVGGTLDDYGQDIVSIGDTLLIAVGYTSSFGNGGEDIYIVALDKRGNVKWSKAIGGSGNERAWSIKQTSDGNLLIIGQTNSFGAGGVDGYVIKLDLSGNILWTRTVGGPGNDFFRSGEETPTGNFILGGWTASFTIGGDDVFVVKLDANGNLSPGCSSCQIGNGGTVVDVVSWIGEFGLVSTGGIQGTPSNSTNGGGSLLQTCLLTNVSVILSGKVKGDNVALKWHVSGSDQIQKFVIEASNNADDFEAIDEVVNNDKDVYNVEVPAYWKFFRIRAILKESEQEVLSNVWVKKDGITEDIVIESVRRMGNTLIIHMFSQGERRLWLELYSVDGKLIEQKQMLVESGRNVIVQPVKDGYPMLLRFMISKSKHIAVII